MDGKRLQFPDFEKLDGAADRPDADLVAQGKARTHQPHRWHAAPGNRVPDAGLLVVDQLQKAGLRLHPLADAFHLGTARFAQQDREGKPAIGHQWQPEVIGLEPVQTTSCPDKQWLSLDDRPAHEPSYTLPPPE